MNFNGFNHWLSQRQIQLLESAYQSAQEIKALEDKYFQGWEVLLEGAIAHFGLPESRVAVNAFIATVPVIIDSCIKFWIFSYLTRYSPAASSIYERMNT